MMNSRHLPRPVTANAAPRRLFWTDMENTKQDGISSGLVPVAWLAPSNYEWPSHFISLTEIRNGEALVRLSDAEAIIAQKDAEILEQCRLNGMGAEREATLIGKVAQQSAALKLPRQRTTRPPATRMRTGFRSTTWHCKSRT